MPLRSARLTGDPFLESCLNGTDRIFSGRDGLTVMRLQAALLDVGLSVGPAGTDGIFGSDTGFAADALASGQILGYREQPRHRLAGTILGSCRSSAGRQSGRPIHRRRHHRRTCPRRNSGVHRERGTAIVHPDQALSGIRTALGLRSFVEEVVARHVHWVVLQELAGTPGSIAVLQLGAGNLAAAAHFYCFDRRGTLGRQ